MNENDDTTRFEAQAVTYLAGGLTPEESAEFEATLRARPDLAEKFNQYKEMDDAMTQLFTPFRPENLDAAILDRLKRNTRWWNAHPAVSRSAAAVAAMLVLGTIGAVGSEWLNNHRFGLPSVNQTVAFESLKAQLTPSAAAMEGVDMDLKNENGRLRGTSGDRARETKGITGKASGVTAPTPGKPMPGSASDGPDFNLNGGYLGTATGGVGGGGGGGVGDKKGWAGNTPAPTTPAPLTAPTPVPSGRFKPGQIDESARERIVKEAQVKFDDGHIEFDKEGKKRDGGKDNAPARPQVAQADESKPGESNQPGQENQSAAQKPPEREAPAVAQRKVIRNGNVEYEVDSFDSAFMTVTKLVTEDGGFIGTTASSKLPNGKISGQIVVRIAPDKLDVLMLKLRSLGDLKRQNLTAQDITKEYVDLESQLRAARAMEERLLGMIKEAKGSIKDLLAAEKELGVWREKIETLQGSINYYNNLVSLSTLTIQLYEKDIKTPTYASETEEANMGVEADDVEKSRADALKAVDDAKGRIIESELKRHDGGQLAFRLIAEVPPDRAGEVIDRLKQLGRVARLDIQRKQTTAGGQGAPAGIKIDRKDTRLIVSIYNLANVAPRQTTTVVLAAENVEKAYRAILADSEKAGGKVVRSQINQQTGDQSVGSVYVELPSAAGDAAIEGIKLLGEVMRVDSIESQDVINTTTTKRGISVTISPLSQVQPRETITLQLAANDVAAAFNSLRDSANQTAASIFVSQLQQQTERRASATLYFDLARTNLAAMEKAINSTGDVIRRQVDRSTDVTNTLDSKVRLQISVINLDVVDPKETTSLRLEVSDVDATLASISGSVIQSGGRIIDSRQSKDPAGQSTGTIVVDVPLQQAGAILSKLKDTGKLQSIDVTRNADVPGGALARARFNIDLANASAIVGENRGVWATIRNGLSTSAQGLLWSLQLIVIGLCFVVPWGLLIWGLVKLARRRSARATQV